MSIGDAGSLEWPLDGDLIYRFGQEQRPNGLVLNWNGVGIAGCLEAQYVLLGMGLLF